MANKQYPRLILASQSPRRRQLFEQAGYQFKVHPPDATVEESHPSQGLSPEELVGTLSCAKAEWVASHYRDGIIVAADTVAECGGEILGKPTDRADAKRMLNQMMNTTHRVLTGVTLWIRPSDQKRTHVEQTILSMDPLSDEQIERYLDSDGWRGKAGGFGYQDELSWIHVLDGLESNVVGFPIEKLDDWIDELV